MAGVMTEVLSKPSAKKFSKEHIESLGDSVSARVARAFNAHPVAFGRDRIEKFLVRKAQRTVEKFKGEFYGVRRVRFDYHGSGTVLLEAAAGTPVTRYELSSIDMGWLSSKKPVAKVVEAMESCEITETWHETAFEKYPHVTPEFVARKYAAAYTSSLFDSIVVATVQEVVKPVTADPLLLGRITGSDLRFFICQWDSDIVLDDII